MNREEAKIYIQDYFKKLEKTSFKELALEELKNKIKINKLLNIFLNKDFQNDITDAELYYLIKFYNKQREIQKFDEIKATDNNLTYKFNEIIIDEDPFTQLEIEEFSNIFIKIGGFNKNEIIFDDVITIEEDRQFLKPIMSGREVAELKDLLSYNYESQREASYKVYRGFDPIKIPTLYQKNVDDIKRKIKEGKFKSNMIAVNILITGDENYIEPSDENENKLSFVREKGSMLNIVDGWHRVTACSQLLSEDPDSLDNVIFQLKIWHLDIEEANDFVEQEASGSAISIEKRNVLKDDLFNRIINNLNKKGNIKNNSLKDKIGDLNQVKLNTKLFAQDTFKHSLIDNIEFENTRKADMFGKYLNEFWNNIIFKFDNEYKNLKKYKKKTALVQNNICLFFNYIAVELQDDSDWRDKLELITDTINFDLNNDIWGKIHIESIRYDKSIRKEIYEYAKSVLNDINIKEGE